MLKDQIVYHYDKATPENLLINKILIFTPDVSGMPDRPVITNSVRQASDLQNL